MADEASINSLLEKIYILKDPQIEESRKQELQDFIKTTINGDTIEASLPINANLGKDNRGALVYVITNLRLIKFEIDAKEIKSVSFPIDTITGIERTLDKDRATIQITFPNNSIGLKYSANNQIITNFFQKVDQLRTTKTKS